MIVPVFNGEEYLDRCIASIINQTFINLDIILIDDGSKDGTWRKFQEWKDKDDRIRLIHKENEGLGKSRNLGVELARYDIITFVDADDWIDESFVEVLFIKMDKTKTDICVCDIWYWDSINNKKNLSKIRFEDDVVSVKENPTIMNKIRTFAWGKLWKKKLFTQELLFPLWTFEDIPSVPLLAYVADKISYVSQGMYNYWRNQQTSLSSRGENIGDIQKSLHLLYKRACDLKISELALLEIKKIMLGQVRGAYRKWYEDIQYRAKLIQLTKSLSGYYSCFKEYEKITFAKNEDSQINQAIFYVAYSDNQVIEGGELIFDFTQFVKIEGEQQKWNVVEYIMEQM